MPTALRAPARRAGAAHERVEAREEFAVRKGFGDILVGTEGERVTMNGAEAQAIAATSNQINAIVPDRVAGLATAAAGAPAARGSVLLFYATGHGLLTASQQLTLPVEVRLGGQGCAILYAGLVPGLPTGSAVPLELRIGDGVSQPGITVMIE